MLRRFAIPLGFLDGRSSTIIAITKVSILAYALAAQLASSSQAWSAEQPNIVYILCDDLGYGDVQAFNPQGKIPTPHIDRLASQGMRFTDAHSGSAVCTPTRYGILTGRYAWRTRLQASVLQGLDPPLVARNRLTVAELLKKRGYQTAIIGKWHLGIEFGKERWTDTFVDGPLDHGFDSLYGFCGSLDSRPFVPIENRRFTAVPDVEWQGFLNGPALSTFEPVNFLPELTRRAVDYLHVRGEELKSMGNATQPADKATRPFFLYLPLTSPHEPFVPSAAWQGKSGLGPYGDFVMQTDAAVGEVLGALDKAGLTDNTLVVFTSDNGPCPVKEVLELKAAGHSSSAQFRGAKADVWEGGHRIPLIMRWEHHIKPGTTSGALVCLNDFIATVADIVGYELPADAGEDSVSLLPLLTGESNAAVHEAVVHHSIEGRFAIRKGKWKLNFCAGSGGWGTPSEPQAAADKLPQQQLYDMSTDEAEQHNLAAAHPEIVNELTALLQKYIDNGRSTPGPKQTNDVEIRVWKDGPPPG